MPAIDYYKINQAVNYYTRTDYEYIEVPWIVSEESHRSLIPFQESDPRYFENKLPDGHLVGSAEAGFFQKMLDETLFWRSYCAVTPCFRTATEIDDWHLRHFMKVELCFYFGKKQLTEEDQKKSTLNLLEDAKIFFSYFIPLNDLLTVETDIGFDIIERKTNIELGSYGYRSKNEHTWCYGTGLALPRLDQVINARIFK